MKQLGATGFLAIGLFFGAGLAQAQDQRIPVDKNFHASEIKINGGIGTVYEYMIDLKDFGGQIAVCGVGKQMEPSSRAFVNDLLRKTKIIINGKTIIKDISYFNQVKKNDDLTKSQAVCRMTGVKPPSGKNNKISIDHGFAVYRD
ncbi:MAG: hypothetical protein KDE03_13250 [Rhodobacteraceae bacterium]|nr:hypothetical protein [Paracoccaceae bacterium]